MKYQCECEIGLRFIQRPQMNAPRPSPCVYASPSVCFFSFFFLHRIGDGGRGLCVCEEKVREGGADEEDGVDAEAEGAVGRAARLAGRSLGPLGDGIAGLEKKKRERRGFMVSWNGCDIAMTVERKRNGKDNDIPSASGYRFLDPRGSLWPRRSGRCLRMPWSHPGRPRRGRCLRRRCRIDTMVISLVKGKRTKKDIKSGKNGKHIRMLA